MSEEIRTVSAAAFTELDKNNITVVDVREPDEILVHPVGNTINVPFSDFPKGLDDIPSEKDVYVLCRTGISARRLPRSSAIADIPRSTWRAVIRRSRRLALLNRTAAHLRG